MTSQRMRRLALEHGLSGEEFDRLCRLLGREPNLTELGMFAAMWSEHCSYKSSRALLERLPTRGDRVIQGPGENAGVVDLREVWVALKIESHNHPSFIEPFQGAATGVGGIIRDVFAMGARPLALLDSLHFGRPDHPRTPYLLEQVVAGISWYGNCVGVPTVGGQTQFDPSYDGNILVNVCCVGAMPPGRLVRAAARGEGNPVVYAGSRTGRDGLHGATMASESFEEDPTARRPAVQVGDPFTEKLLMEACLELAQRGELLVGLQDMGAAGLTCSSAEMAARGGVGMELDLDRVPRRQEGLTPYEVMLSESQERMLLVVRRGGEGEALDLFRRWELEATVVGRVTSDGRLRLRQAGRVVADVPVRALVEEAPRYERPRRAPDRRPCPPEPPGMEPSQALLRMLGSPDMGDRSWIYRQYDWAVQANTVVGPGRAGAAVLRLKGTRRGIGLTLDANPRWCALDPRAGARAVVAEAARNLVCVGARPLAVSDCLNFGNPERPEVMWAFAECVEGMAEACRELGIPVVSGNVSFYNETRGRGVHPTPVVAMLGELEEVERHLEAAFRRPGDVVALLGGGELAWGGSHYLWACHGLLGGRPARVDLGAERRLHRVCLRAVQEGLLRSAQDVSEGGLGVALAECLLLAPPGLGAEVELAEPSLLELFGEGGGRVLVSLPPAALGRLRGIAEREEVPLRVLGRVTEGGRLRVREMLDVPVERLRARWAGALREVVR